MRKITRQPVFFHFGVLLLAGVFLTAACSAPDGLLVKATARTIFDVRSFDAVGDGNTLDTRALQAAIDAAHQAGGGSVYLGPGSYLSGTIFLKDNVTLYLAQGATLLGSTDANHYPATLPKRRSYTDYYVEQSLLTFAFFIKVYAAGANASSRNSNFLS